MGASSIGNFFPCAICPHLLSSAISPARSSVPVFAAKTIGPCIRATYCFTLGRYSTLVCIGRLISITSPFFHFLLIIAYDDGNNVWEMLLPFTFILKPPFLIHEG